VIDTLDTAEIFLKVQGDENAVCTFGYSTNDTDYLPVPIWFKASAGKWMGAKIGFFCIREGFTNNSGYVKIDWFRVDKK
jgi:hypothetical protein